jgi:hypothetical protein
METGGLKLSSICKWLGFSLGCHCDPVLNTGEAISRLRDCFVVQSRYGGIELLAMTTILLFIRSVKER